MVNLPLRSLKIGTVYVVSILYHKRIQYKLPGVARKEIRLRKFLPWRSDDPNRIELSLGTVSLDNCRVYHALSYISGDDTLNWSVYVDGNLSHVTKILKSPGNRLGERLDTEPFDKLWVEGI
jgi:hypothetical protein